MPLTAWRSSGTSSCSWRIPARLTSNPPSIRVRPTWPVARSSRRSGVPRSGGAKPCASRPRTRWILALGLLRGATRRGALGAVCIPLNVVGRSIGVLHVAAREGALPSNSQIVALESIAEQTSARIGIVRVMEQSHLQAATDPLTGLLNRRSLENQTHELVRTKQQFAIAMGDLDHFKNLYDTHGHDAGDRALRIFARTLRSALRGDDIISRYGGEEFVIVFPGLTALDASNALERVREALVLALASGSIPPFTSSYGVADTRDADSLEELLRLADTALFHAKRQGRNRVVIDQSATSML